jgi:hypothetical protein
VEKVIHMSRPPANFRQSDMLGAAPASKAFSTPVAGHVCTLSVAICGQVNAQAARLGIRSPSRALERIEAEVFFHLIKDLIDSSN